MLFSKVGTFGLDVNPFKICANYLKEVPKDFSFQKLNIPNSNYVLSKLADYTIHASPCVQCIPSLPSAPTQDTSSTQSTSSTLSTYTHKAHSDSPSDSVALLIKVNVRQIQTRLQISCGRGVEDVFSLLNSEDREVFYRAHREYSEAVRQLEHHICAYLKVRYC